MTRLEGLSTNGTGSKSIATVRWGAVLVFLSFVVLTGLWAYLWVH